MHLIYLLIGIVSGYFAGFLGVGAGVVLMPVFMLMNIPYLIAVKVSLMAVLLSSITGAIQNHGSGGTKWEPLMVMCVPAAFFALLGNLYLIHMISVMTLQIIFAGLMFLNVDLLKASGKISKGRMIDPDRSEKRYFPVYLMTGSLAGLAASLLGIGGGCIIVTLLICLAKLDPKESVKLAIATMIVTTFFALLPDLATWNLPFEVGLITSVGAIFGGFFGTLSLKYVGQKVITRCNYVISFSLGLTMLLKAVLP